eukprot:TRINITY_DN94429_c0_g1_i1.p1 TRINITY_DN94429_c0_g1~~TRINITY_DN94429_c0_g1_i1.p1  ORF type:complete len:224 (+),score=41.30 TRINITY_DN94429_c0_g1_i1:39-710(+)
MHRMHWQRLKAVGKAYPFAVGVAVGTVKTGASDFTAQKLVERRDKIDWPRLTCFTLLGFSWVGCLQQVVYVNAFSKIFPHANRFTSLPTLQARLQDSLGIRDLIGQTAFVNFAWCPMFFYFFYAFQEFVHGVSRAGAGARNSAGVSWAEMARQGLENSRTNFWDAMQRCNENILEDLKICWMIWIPGHLVTFAVPMWLRMPLTHTLSFLFFGILSCMRGELEE